MENKQTMIEVQNLCKSFHKLEVLKDISTTFYKNEGRLHHWTLRRRQVDVPAVPEPAGKADLRTYRL